MEKSGRSIFFLSAIVAIIGGFLLANVVISTFATKSNLINEKSTIGYASVLAVSGSPTAVSTGVVQSKVIPHLPIMTGRFWLPPPQNNNFYVKAVFCGNQYCSQNNSIHSFGAPLDVGPSATGAGWGEIRYGSDGLPILVHDYYDSVNGKYQIRIVHCTDNICNNFTQSFGPLGATGVLAMQIGSDGNPIFAYRKDFFPTNNKIVFVHCLNVTCSQQDPPQEVTAIGTKFIDQGIKLAVGSDGFPVLTAVDLSPAGNSLAFIKCNNLNCSLNSIKILDASSGSGALSDIAINSQGNPVITYSQNPFTTSHSVKLIVCNQVDCGGTNAIQTVATDGFDSTILLRGDDRPLIAYHSSGLKVLDCLDSSCSQKNAYILDSDYEAGRNSSIGKGFDKTPIIVYLGGNWMKISKCLTNNCSQSTNNIVVNATPTDIGTTDSYGPTTSIDTK